MKLEDLGITTDDLVGRIVDRLVDNMEESGDERIGGKFDRAIAARVEALVVAAVDKSTKKKIEVAVGEVIERPWRSTNKYGEDAKKPMTFKEMVTARLDEYLAAKVKGDGSAPRNYDDHTTPRIDWLIQSQVKAEVGEHIKRAAAEAAIKAREQVLGGMNDAVIAAVKNVLGIKGT